MRDGGLKVVQFRSVKDEIYFESNLFIVVHFNNIYISTKLICYKSHIFLKEYVTSDEIDYILSNLIYSVSICNIIFAKDFQILIF